MKQGMDTNRLWLLGVFLAAALAFEPALLNTFTFDDVHQVQGQAVPATAAGWLRAAAAPWWPPDRQKNIWRPVTRLTILAQKAAGGETAWPFYAFNIALHGAVCALLFLLARRLGWSTAAAGLGALLFAVHPMHAEAIHQVVGRAELLAAFWMLVGLLCFFRWPVRNWRAWVAQPLCFALALGSKEHALVYPGLLFLAAMAGRAGEGSEPQAARPWRRFLAPLRGGALWGLGALLILILALFFAAKAAITGGVLEPASSVPYFENPLAGMGLLRRLPAVLGIFGYAASRLAWPLHLSPDYSAYSLPVERGWAWGWCWAGALVLAGAVAWAVRDAARGRRGWTLAAAALGAYALTSNGPYTIGVITAQRLWYWPSAPALMGAGWLAAEGLRRLGEERRRLGALALAAVTLGLMTLSWGQAVAWRSPADFARQTVKIFSGSWRGQVDAARACYLERPQPDFAAGFHHARAATLLFPEKAMGWAWLGANAMFLPGRQDMAEYAFRRALQLDPQLYETHRHYGHLLASQGRRAEAARELEAFLASPVPSPADKEKVRREIEGLRAAR